MGSCWDAVCATVLVFVCLSSACTDVDNCYQREVTFDKFLTEREPQESDLLQKEVDLKDLLDLGDLHHIEQRIVSPPVDLGQTIFQPRSFARTPLRSYPVQFPLGRPTPDNIQAICLHADHRPKYPDSYFPRSGFGKQVRMGRAVNRAESWFSECCKGNETWGAEGRLCCATQAWEKSVNLFCEDDSSVKDRLYECCRLRDNERLDCFNADSPNPSYGPTEELPVEPLHSADNFHFNLNLCPRNLMMASLTPRANKRTTELNPSTSQNSDISFPPGRPTTDNIESLCGNQKLRPIYTTKCLPPSGYQLLARKVKTINRLEKGFKRCCKRKKGLLNCAEQKWREELNKYCSARNNEQSSPCCLVQNATDRFSCFQSASPDPQYGLTPPTEEPSLNEICKNRKINARFPVGFSMKIFVKQCCPLPEEDQTNCMLQMLVEPSENFCSPNKSPSPDVRRCCSMPSREDVIQCVSKLFTEAISRATQVKRKKTKKRCPIP